MTCARVDERRMGRLVNRIIGEKATSASANVGDDYAERERLLVLRAHSLESMAVKTETTAGNIGTSSNQNKGIARGEKADYDKINTNPTEQANKARASLGPEDLAGQCYVRQVIRPQCRLSLKFHVCEPARDLSWCFRVSGGTLMFSVSRRPTIRQVVKTDRVSEFTFATPATQATAAKTPSRERGQEQDQIDTIDSAQDSFNHDSGPNMIMSVFEEVEEDAGSSEDMEAAPEVVRPSERIFYTKEFIRGHLRAYPGYTYTVVLENVSTFFPSKTVEYDVRLMDNDSTVGDCDDGHDTEEEKSAKMEDLLHFVSEITCSEAAATHARCRSSSKRKKRQQEKKEEDQRD